jgi:hypothetical protein
MTDSSLFTENPYFGLPLSFEPDKYYGSQYWINFILQWASNDPPRSLELIGLPGMGKSSLLRNVANPKGALVKNKESLRSGFRSDPSRMFPLLVEYRLLPTDSHPFIYLFQRFDEEYTKYRERLVQDKTDLPTFGKAVEIKKPEQALSLLDEQTKKLNDHRIRPLFLLDDFDLAFVHLTQIETTRLRPWRDRVSFVLATERRLDRVNAEAAGSPFYQTLPHVYIGGLVDEDARRLVSEPAKKSDWPLHSDDIQWILEQAGNHPYLLIQACSVFWSFRERIKLTMSDNVQVSSQHGQILLGYLKMEFRTTFRLYWENLDPAERDTLRSVASGKELNSGQYGALASLEERGLSKYDPNRKAHVPFSPLFREFITNYNTHTGLSSLEASLYEFLERNADRTCSFEELSQAIWKLPFDGAEEDKELIRRRMQVTVSRLRKKLQESANVDILSIRDQGYRLVQVTA